MAALKPDKASKPSLAFEAEYWAKAKSRFIDFLKSEGVHPRHIQEIMQNRSDPNDVQSSIQASQRVGDAAYGKVASAVIGKMDILISMGDFAFKGGPESIGLVWSGLKFVFAGIKSDYETCHLLADACVTVVGILIECRVYGGIFLASMDASKDAAGYIAKIQECIENAYLGILKFSYLAQKHFDKKKFWRTVKAVILSPVSDFKAKVDDVASVEANLIKWAKLALVQRNEENQGKMLENDQRLLDVAKIQHEESLASQERFQTQINEKLDGLVEMVNSKLTLKTPLQLAEEECLRNLKSLQQLFPLANQLRDSTPMYDLNTCQWIFKLDAYKSWAAGPRGILWLYGGIGIGKSALMEAILDELNNRFRNDDRYLIQYHACKFGDDDLHKACRIMAKMIVLVYSSIKNANELEDRKEANLREANEIFRRCTSPKEGTKIKNQNESAKIEFYEASGRGTLLTLGQLHETYEGLIRVAKLRIFLLIDGLEQCDEPGQESIASRLSLIAGNDNASVSILVASRPQPGDFDAILEKSKIPTIMVKDHTAEDIKTVIRQGINQISGWAPFERSMACDEVFKAAKGLFRYIPQAVAFLDQPFERPLENRLKQLKDLPNGVQGLYQQEFKSINPVYLKLVKTALTWTALSSTDVTVDEVMDAFSGTFTEKFAGGAEDVPTHIEPTQLKKARVSFLTFRPAKDQVTDVAEDSYASKEGPLQHHYFVQIRDEEIKKFFLQESADLESGENSGEYTSEAQIELNEQRDWRINQLDGHLSIAKTCLLHLNSPLFQKKFLLATPFQKFLLAHPLAEIENSRKNEQIEKTMDLNSKEDIPILPVDSLDIKMIAPGLETLGKVDEDTNRDVSLQPIGTFDSEPETKAPALSQNLNNSQTNNTYESSNENAKEIRDLNQKSTDISGVTLNTEMASIDVPEAVSEAGIKADSGINDEDFELPSNISELDYEIDEEERLNNAATMYEPFDEIAGERVRYELTNWFIHLQKAEQLLPSHQHERLAEIWVLVESFFDNEPAMNAWKNKFEYDVNANQLQIACALGLTGLVERLLKGGADPNHIDGNGCTALSYVQADVKPELIRLLLQHGADPNFVDEVPGRKTVPPLHLIIGLDPQTEVIRLLLDIEKGANPFAMDRFGETALHYFAYNGSGIDKLELLMKCEGADINIANENGSTPLHYLLARTETDIELLKAFLEKGADPTRDDKFSQQPLCFVCGKGDIESMNCLIDIGVDIYDDNLKQETALHQAARNGHLTIIKRLYELADDKQKLLSKEDKFGRTPFYLACSNENQEIPEFLLRLMIDHKIENINKQVESGKTPLRKAAFRGHTGILRMLLDLPGVKDTVNNQGDVSQQTPLHAAAYRGHKEAIALLLAAGADITLKDKFQHTPLQKCYQSWGRGESDEPEQALALLIDHNPEAAARDLDMFSLAAMRGSIFIVKKLLEVNADPSGVDELGWTPLQVAQQFGQEEVVKMLKERIAEREIKPQLWILRPDNEDLVKISDDGLVLEYIKERLDEFILSGFVTTLANCPIPIGLNRYYYEISISAESKKSKLAVGIGLSTKPIKTVSTMPGWFWRESGGFTWGFHGDDSYLYGSPGVRGKAYAGRVGFGHGHTIGCGWNVKEGTLFYTRDGVLLDVAFQGVKGRLFPAVGLAEKAIVETNFGNDVVKKPFKWTPANDASFKW